MITIEEMQFGGLLTMVMLTLMLVLCVPRRSKHHAGFGCGRWLMAAGTLLVAVQFALQHIGGFRHMGVSQAVLWNLLFFLPAGVLINIAVLYIQRRGNVSRRGWLWGGAACGLNTLILVTTLLVDGIPMAEESAPLRRAEYASAVLFLVIQCYYLQMHLKEYRRLQQAVDEFYDHERRDLLGWMARSVILLGMMALMVPLAIFFQGVPLKVFSMFFFFVIAYCVISFYRYGISEDMVRVEESEDADGEEVTTNCEEKKEDADTLDDDVKLHVEEAMKQWKKSGVYREHDLTLSSVAHQMNIPQKQLRLWLRQSAYGKLATLVTTLRIEEAKSMLAGHPEWTIDYVADYCGFNSREYFHQVFLEKTGTTPAKYQAGAGD